MQGVHVRMANTFAFIGIFKSFFYVKGLFKLPFQYLNIIFISFIYGTLLRYTYSLDVV